MWCTHDWYKFKHYLQVNERLFYLFQASVTMENWGPESQQPVSSWVAFRSKHEEQVSFK